MQGKGRSNRGYNTGRSIPVASASASTASSHASPMEEPFSFKTYNKDDILRAGVCTPASKYPEKSIVIRLNAGSTALSGGSSSANFSFGTHCQENSFTGINSAFNDLYQKDEHGVYTHQKEVIKAKWRRDHPGQQFAEAKVKNDDIIMSHYDSVITTPINEVGGRQSRVAYAVGGMFNSPTLGGLDLRAMLLSQYQMYSDIIQEAIEIAHQNQSTPVHCLITHLSQGAFSSNDKSVNKAIRSTLYLALAEVSEKIPTNLKLEMHLDEKYLNNATHEWGVAKNLLKSRSSNTLIGELIWSGILGYTRPKIQQPDPILPSPLVSPSASSPLNDHGSFLTRVMNKLELSSILLPADKSVTFIGPGGTGKTTIDLQNHTFQRENQRLHTGEEALEHINSLQGIDKQTIRIQGAKGGITLFNGEKWVLENPVLIPAEPSIASSVFQDPGHKSIILEDINPLLNLTDTEATQPFTALASTFNLEQPFVSLKAKTIKDDTTKYQAIQSIFESTQNYFVSKKENIPDCQNKETALVILLAERNNALPANWQEDENIKQRLLQIMNQNKAPEEPAYTKLNVKEFIPILYSRDIKAKIQALCKTLVIHVNNNPGVVANGGDQMGFSVWKDKPEFKKTLCEELNKLLPQNKHYTQESLDMKNFSIISNKAQKIAEPYFSSIENKHHKDGYGSRFIRLALENTRIEQKGSSSMIK